MYDRLRSRSGISLHARRFAATKSSSVQFSAATCVQFWAAANTGCIWLHYAVFWLPPFVCVCVCLRLSAGSVAKPLPKCRFIVVWRTASEAREPSGLRDSSNRLLGSNRRRRRCYSGGFPTEIPCTHLAIISAMRLG